jgi:CheY-like chemotaxis protein
MLLILGSNAKHAMENRAGSLTISATIETVEHLADMNGKVLAPGRYALIVVADTGEGIAEEVLPHIFDPSFTTKEFGKGGGMGLTIVHGIVDGHSGAVQVTSIPGQGSSFSVYLPIHQLPEGVEGSAVPSGGNQRLLLVDDDRGLLTATAESLRRHGYRVEAVASPLEALKRFTTSPEAYDLVITDMTMPEMNGDLLAARMLTLRAELPIILCTGYSESIDEKRATLLEIRCYLEKPLSAAMLVQAVHGELHRELSATVGG